MERSRKLSNEDFINVLQLEYFTHKLRALIYERPEFKKMNNDIAEKKKQKILDLSAKFRLLNIFDSQVSFDLFWHNCFLNEYGLPNFQYNPHSKEGVMYWDKFYSLCSKTAVVYKGKTYVVKKNWTDKDEIGIIIEGKLTKVSYNDVKIEKFLNLSTDALR